MKRSIRQLVWQWVLLGALLVLGGATSALAQNTFPWPASGDVGIGTASPDSLLSVSGGDILIQTNNKALKATALDGSNQNVLLLNTANQLNLGGMDGPSSIATLRVHTSGMERIRIDINGNVGIGTASPTAKLHVAGDAKVDGNLAAKYQDVAEWVKAPPSLFPGMVVVVNPQEIDQVLPASQPYDTRVAGVVSARPGLLLGEAGPDKVKVAQSGRVRVKVDTAYGPIAAGDLLVTSPTPGHAMRSSPVKLGETLIHRPGTLLGKALEPLEDGQGEILVLLTLQ